MIIKFSIRSSDVCSAHLLHIIIDDYFQHIELGLTARKQALVDNIDAWAMWISPPIFLVFNLVYWVSFRHVGAELFTFS